MTPLPRTKERHCSKLESLTYSLAGVMVFQQFDDVSLMAA